MPRCARNDGGCAVRNDKYLKMPIEVFNRTEMKYLITEEEKNKLLSLLGDYMDSDPYNTDGNTYPIYNLYLDTPSNELIIKSLEKPVYKEKIRLRSYGLVCSDDAVYLESKKKYDSVVYKRRTSIKLKDAYSYFENKNLQSVINQSKINKQVLKEIDYIMNYYPLQPRVFISYDRLAFFEKNNSDFRLTLDTNIRTRRTDLRLDSNNDGIQLLPDGKWLMEAKAFKSFPLWFVHFLSENKIFSTSFSKYGTEYQLYRKENCLK